MLTGRAATAKPHEQPEVTGRLGCHFCSRVRRPHRAPVDLAVNDHVAAVRDQVWESPKSQMD